MQTMAFVPPDQFPDLLKRLPAGLDLDALATIHSFVNKAPISKLLTQSVALLTTVWL